MKIGAPLITPEQAADRLGLTAEADARPTTGEWARSSLAAAADDLLERLDTVLTPEGLARPGKVRKLRITARRLESCGRVFAGALTQRTIARSRKTGRAVRKALGELRSVDAVTSMLSSQHACDSAVRGYFVGWLTRERSALLPDARAALDRVNPAKLRDAIDDCDVLDGLSAWSLVEPFARRAFEGEPQPGDTAGNQTNVAPEPEHQADAQTMPQPDEIHAFRVRFKRVRFAMEALGPPLAAEVGPEIASRYAWVYTTLKVFGKLSDAVDARRLIALAADDAGKGPIASAVRDEAASWDQRVHKQHADAWTWWSSHRALVLDALGRLGERSVELGPSVQAMLDDAATPPPTDDARAHEPGAARRGA